MRYFRNTIVSAIVALACLVAVPSAVYASDNCDSGEMLEGSIWFVVAVGNSILCVSGSLINCIAAGAMLVEGATAERCFAHVDLGPADHRLV